MSDGTRAPRVGGEDLAGELLGFQDQRSTGRYRFSSLVGEGEVIVLFGSVVEASYAGFSGAAAIGAMLDAPPGKVEWLDTFEMPHLGGPLPESLSEMVDQWRQNREDAVADAVESPRPETVAGAADSGANSSWKEGDDPSGLVDAVGPAPTPPPSVEEEAEDPWGESVPTPDVVGALDLKEVPALPGTLENGGVTSADADSICAPPLDAFEGAADSLEEQPGDETEAASTPALGPGWDADDAIVVAPDILGVEDGFDSEEESSMAHDAGVGAFTESISAPAEDPFAYALGEPEATRPAAETVGKYTATHEASDPESGP